MVSCLRCTFGGRHNKTISSDFLLFILYVLLALFTNICNHFDSNCFQFPTVLAYSANLTSPTPICVFALIFFQVLHISLSYVFSYCMQIIVLLISFAFAYCCSVYADGSICLDILQNQWSPIYDVAAILTSIQVYKMF